MPFIHPAIFWAGLGAAGVPIVIHLLNRRRFRLRDWAAMQFLMDSLRRNRRRLRIEELILLALRCLAVMLLAMAVARFTGCGVLSVLPGGDSGDKAVVFVLDDSASMGHRAAGRTTFLAATGDLIKQIEQTPATAKVAILLTSGAAAGEEFFPLGHVTDPADLVDRLRGLRPSDTRADLAGAIEVAAGSLPADSISRRLLVMSDFRRADLADKEQAQRLRKVFAEMKRSDVPVTALDYGRAAARNLTVESMKLLDRYVLTAGKGRGPGRIRLIVRNNGAEAAGQVPVRLSTLVEEDGKSLTQQLPVRKIPRIEPGASATAELTYAPARAGHVAVVAEVGNDELSADNTGRLVLDVRPAVRALVVDGNPSVTDPEQSESFYFNAALDPTDDAEYGCRVSVIGIDEIARVNLADYELVALLDVAGFPGEAGAAGEQAYPGLAALARYVRGGGGLVIFTGDHVNVDFYNGPFYAEGAGLNPLRIAARKGSPATTTDFVRIDPDSVLDEAITDVFTRPRREGVDITALIRFSAYTPASRSEPVMNLPYVKAPRVLARFAAQRDAPAIVSRQYGRGTVLMVYTTASKRWNDWPTEPNGTNVAFMHDVVAALAAGKRPHAAPVGVPISFELPEAFRDAQARLKTPVYPAREIISLVPVTRFEELNRRIGEAAGKPAAADVRAEVTSKLNAAGEQIAEGDARGAHATLAALAATLAAAAEADNAQLAAIRRILAQAVDDVPESLLRRQVRCDRPQVAGVYALTLQQPEQPLRTILLARSVDPAEGDLEPGRQEGLAAAFGCQAADFTYVDRTSEGASTRLDAGPQTEYWVWAIAAMLAVLAAETFLAQKFGHYAQKGRR